MGFDKESPRGRGTLSNPEGRFEAFVRSAEDDGWGILDEAPSPLATTLSVDASRKVITFNQSPDVSFDRSINPYRGCEHGCVYCFARPTHAWSSLSPGLDFESKLFYKADAAVILRRELSAPSYRCQPIALGVNTDAYQPSERKLKITRAILEVLSETQHPVILITKSALIERDIDILAPMAKKGLAGAAVSITTLDRKLARLMEPRAAAPQRRIDAIRALSAAGIPTAVSVAPIIPVLTEPEIESILDTARDAGATSAGYVMLRLPHEVKDLFKDWLNAHHPLKAEHIMNHVRAMRGGKEYDSRFGVRGRGMGEYADLIAKRFALRCRKLGFQQHPELTTSLFQAPNLAGQLSLF